MSARFFSTDRPTQRGTWGVPLQPMSPEDRAFWRIFHERKAKEQGKASPKPRSFYNHDTATDSGR